MLILAGVTVSVKCCLFTKCDPGDSYVLITVYYLPAQCCNLSMVSEVHVGAGIHEEHHSSHLVGNQHTAF